MFQVQWSTVAYQPWSGAQPSTKDVILPQEWGSESPGFFLTRKSFGVSTSFCPILAVISHSDFTAVQTHLELFVAVAAVCSDYLVLPLLELSCGSRMIQGKPIFP